jgi:hypothetical protein
MHKDGETELSQVWTRIEKIRAKQAAKPKFSSINSRNDGSSGLAAVTMQRDRLMGLLREILAADEASIQALESMQIPVGGETVALTEKARALVAEIERSGRGSVLGKQLSE